jgi:hypothetical protein
MLETQYLVTIGPDTAGEQPKFGEFLQESFQYTCYVLSNTYAIKTNKSQVTVFNIIRDHVGQHASFFVAAINSPWEAQHCMDSITWFG